VSIQHECPGQKSCLVCYWEEQVSEKEQAEAQENLKAWLVFLVICGAPINCMTMLWLVVLAAVVVGGVSAIKF
jgi:hypothetical protein